MPVNRAPNIPTIGLAPNPDLAARLPAPLFLIPRVGIVIQGDTGQNTAHSLLLLALVLVLVLVLVKRLTRGLGPMFYCRPPRNVLIKTFIYVRPRRIIPHLLTPLKTCIYAHPRRITPLPATTLIRFVIIK